MFGGLEMEGQPDGSSVRNILEDSFTEERMVAGKDIYLKEGSSLQPLSQGIILTAQLQQSRYMNTGIHLHPLKSIKK